MKTAWMSAAFLCLVCGSGVAIGDGSCGESAPARKQSHAAAPVSHARNSGGDAMGEANIVETAMNAGSFKTLCAALKAAGLVGTLEGKGPFTVFAPTDEAFEKLGSATLEELLKPENKERLVAILTYHVVPGRVLAENVRTMGVASVNGQRINLVAEHGKVRVDSANVVKADVLASNGVIHVIDTVILPSDQNVVQTAMKAGDFTTLCKLIKAAGLAESLSGPGPYTVFAPTDEAFARIDPARLESLMKPENAAKLKQILKYHVVKGRVFSDQAVKAGQAKTAAGQSVEIEAKGKSILINDARVVSADIDASNGVVHAIDLVLMPE
ncbi:MAG: fasciclin domain-containing protein [Phycisphaerae bacterium]|nr:fasciclin domain-containing protein [Phycisphaerae bacterium]